MTVAEVLGVFAAVPLLLADVVAVAVDEGVAPVVSDGVGVPLPVRLPLSVAVADAELPRDTEALLVDDDEAPKDSVAVDDSEREDAAVAEREGDRKLLLVAVTGLDALVVPVGDSEGVELPEAAAPRERLADAVGVPEAPLEGLAVELMERDEPNERDAERVPVGEKLVVIDGEGLTAAEPVFVLVAVVDKLAPVLREAV